LLGVINDVAPGPVKVLVNTHHHGDHTHGNGWFPGATIVSHRSTRDAICELNTANSRLRFPGVDFGELRPTPPLLTFDERVYLNVGDMLLDVFFPGVAHCGGDTVVHLREPSLLFGGDVVMNGCTPGFVGGSAQGYLAVIQQLRALGVERIVPGHGAICEPSVLDEIDGYVRWILSVADEGVAAGYSPLEAARRADLGPFAQWLDHERIVGNLYRAYHEIEGTSIDWSAVWADTEAYLGRPIRSMA
jgi:cyclase